MSATRAPFCDVDDDFQQRWVLARGAEGVVGLLERKARIDESVELDAAGGGERDRDRVRVRVAERSDERELAALQDRDRKPRLEPRPHADEHRDAGGPEREDG